MKKRIWKQYQALRALGLSALCAWHVITDGLSSDQMAREADSYLESIH